MGRIILLGLSVWLTSCATEPPTATPLAAQGATLREPKELPPQAPTLKQQSLLLKIGMSEREVTKLLGPPSQAEVSTCGGNTPRGPWTCRTVTYQNGQRSDLRALFSEKAGEWWLNSWTVL